VLSLKKFFFLFFCILGFFYLSNKNILSQLTQIESFIIHFGPQLAVNDVQKDAILTQHVNQQPNRTSSSIKVQPAPISTEATGKYHPTVIQTYRVTVENGKLAVNGNATPYGKFYHAQGVILDIQEARSNTKITIKVPFHNGKIHYEYPLHYKVGEVILNLNEFYKGKTNDPNTVLGYAVYHLTDGDPYLLPSFMVQSDNNSLKTLAQKIIYGKHSDLEKSRAIFDWVANNVSYNYRLVNSPKPPLYSALQTYQTRDVLCSGYADLNAALHRAVGLEAKVMYGENHAWNEIKLNGKWQPEDPTYGSGFINLNTGKFVHRYQSAYFSKTDMHIEGEYPW
jgi:hypothetical protein